MSDGCVFLMGEVARVRLGKDKKQDTKAVALVLKHLMSLADLGYVDHFKHAAVLKENLYKVMIELITDKSGVGKKKFR